jgi:enoyl-[acyl-carrier protein] reductase I
VAHLAISLASWRSAEQREEYVGILEGKKILITGVLTDTSLAFATAQLAQAEGADIVLSGFGRGLSLTNRVASKLAVPPEVIELDVTDEKQLKEAARAVAQLFGRLDGLVHSIGFAPPSALGQGMFAATWQDVATTLEVSSYSLKALAETFLPLLETAGAASIVGFDLDASVAWPGYDWMGVAKASLESLSRYLARDLGSKNIRVNLVAAGPIRTVAARAIPGFQLFEDAWAARAPLGWNVNDSDAIAHACVALLSDWFPRTTGEIIHVDGGYHAVGA